MNKIILRKGDKYGIWNYKTGEILEKNLSILSQKYRSLYFVNDFLLVGYARANPITSSILDLLSVSDGSIVREYGLKEKMDEEYNILSMNRIHLYKFDNYVMCYSMAHDTIYGINKTTLDLEPRFVLNLGDMLINSLSIPQPSYINISGICESSRYLFVEYFKKSDETSNFIYYDKKEGKTFYLAKDAFSILLRKNPGFNDDLTPHGIRFFPIRITSDDKAYAAVQAADFVDMVGTERAAELGVNEEDNPIVIVVKLKR